MAALFFPTTEPHGRNMLKKLLLILLLVPRLAFAFDPIPECARDGAHALTYDATNHRTFCSAISGAGGGAALAVGTSSVTGTTDKFILYNNAGTLGAYGITGSGTTAVLSTSPTFTTGITISAGSIITDTTTGLKIGTGTTQKLGFFNSTPVVQQTGNVCTAMQNLGLVASCTTGGVSSFTGDGGLLSNSASTGAVTATLTNAAANSVWGNNTSSPAAPSYQTSIALAGDIFTNGVLTNARNPSLSSPSVNFAGSPETGGTGTTTTPYALVQGIGASAVTSWSTAGSFFGFNSNSGFTGNFLDMHVNGGASVFKVAGSGAVTATSFAGSGTSLTSIGTASFSATGTANSTTYLRGDNTWATVPSGGLTVASTAIASGTTTRVLFDNAGVLGEYVITGTGNVVMSASPTLTGTITAAAVTLSGTLTTNLTGGGTQCVQVDNSGVLSATGSACGSGGGAVSSVTATNTTLTISPTTGSVLAGINLANANTWTAPITISTASVNALSIGTAGATNPAWNIDTATNANAQSGLNYVAAATGGTATLTVTDPGANGGLNFATKGNGQLNFTTTSGNMTITGGNSITLAAGGGNRIVMNSNGNVSFTPNGASNQVPMNLVTPAQTSLTAATESPVWTIGSAATRQHATGSLPLDGSFIMTGAVHSFVGASTAAEIYTLKLVSPGCGTNGTCTMVAPFYHASQSLAGTVANSAIIDIAADTGGTVSNYAIVVRSGNVSIGTTVATNPLTVNGTASATLFSGSGASLTSIGTASLSATGTANGTTFLRGDNTWATVFNSVSGTSGGIPYFNTTTSLASSAALTANGIVYGGGAGTAPSSMAACSSGVPVLGGSTAPVCGTDANLAYLDVNQSWTKGQAVTPTAGGTQSAGGTLTPDFSASNSVTATFGAGNLTIANPSNVKAGQTYQIVLTQDGTGGRTVTWGANYKFTSNTPPILSTGAGVKDIISCLADTTTTINCAFAVPGTAPAYGILLQAIGTSIASAGTIAPINGIQHVTGTSAIATITLPTGMSATVGGCVTLIADAAWTTTTAGNIFAIMTASAGTKYYPCYDGSKWYF